MSRVLFILRRRDGFDPIKHTDPSLQCGLYNSISYVRDMLISEGIDSQISICIDNNCINGFVYHYKPTHVVIEALWVVPEKIKLLQSMYPKIIWIVRLHSAIPFLSIESSMSMKWLAEYSLINNVYISVNDLRLKRELDIYLSNIIEKEIIYLPNYYPINDLKEYKRNIQEKDVLNISCFGAIRPFKNHMTQALASIEFCKNKNKKLRFHINAGRNELNGSNVYTNMVNLFDKLNENFELVCHPWANREEFLNICENEIDFGLQVSFTETFNLVSADLVSKGVPIIGSTEIPWLLKEYTCNPVDVNDIINIIEKIYEDLNTNVVLNQKSLVKYVDETKKLWLKYLLIN